MCPHKYLAARIEGELIGVTLPEVGQLSRGCELVDEFQREARDEEVARAIERQRVRLKGDV